MGSVTIGYKYFVGMHMALCHGPVDSLHRIRVNEKVVWEGENTGGAITIDKASIFGGDKREGGISGTLDFEQGGPAQTANDYLVGQLGASTPAFRGVCAAVLRHMYLGTSGYLKPWDFLMQRVNTLASGEAQWYPEKAAIPVCAEPAAGLGDGWAILPGENDGTGGGGGGDGGGGISGPVSFVFVTFERNTAEQAVDLDNTLQFTAPFESGDYLRWFGSGASQVEGNYAQLGYDIQAMDDFTPYPDYTSQSEWNGAGVLNLELYPPNAVVKFYEVQADYPDQTVTVEMGLANHKYLSDLVIGDSSVTVTAYVYSGGTATEILGPYDNVVGYTPVGGTLLTTFTKQFTPTAVTVSNILPGAGSSTFVGPVQFGDIALTLTYDPVAQTLTLV